MLVSNFEYFRDNVVRCPQKMSAWNSKCLHTELQVLLHGIQNASMRNLRNIHVNFTISECIKNQKMCKQKDRIKNTMVGKGIQKIFAWALKCFCAEAQDSLHGSIPGLLCGIQNRRIHN